MDDVNCCLSKVIHLCIESSIFLNQLYKFEYQLAKLYSLDRIPSMKLFSILDRFSMIINDLNIYYKTHFLISYSHIFNYLSHKHFTLNCSNEIMNDFHEDLNRLNYFLNHHQKYYMDVFYYVHKLSVTCSLCIQYRRSCTHFEFINRFACIRTDLLTNLKHLNNKIKFLLIHINSNFEKRRQASIKHHNDHYSKETIKISCLFRTVCIWLITIFLIGCYVKWPIDYESNL